MTTDRFSVAVLGSCTTRDNFNSRFNAGYKELWDCTETQMQSSIISMMSEGFQIPDDKYGDLTPYQRGVVRSDTTKEFLEAIARTPPDYLILDFFGDIHFGCLRLPDGRYITNNRWQLWRTDYYNDLQEEGSPLEVLRIEDDTNAYMRLWQESFDRLVAYLRDQCPRTKVVIHRGFNTDKVWVEDEQKLIPLRQHKKVQKIDVPVMNDLWARLDDYAIQAGGFDSIDLRGSGYTTYSAHPWGPFYVHYRMGYYREFLGKLSSIALRDSLVADGHSRASALLGAVLDGLTAESSGQLERLTSELARLRRRLDAQRTKMTNLQHELHARNARLDALTGRSLIRPVVRAGRRLRRR